MVLAQENANAIAESLNWKLIWGNCMKSLNWVHCMWLNFHRWMQLKARTKGMPWHIHTISVKKTKNVGGTFLPLFIWPKMTRYNNMCIPSVYFYLLKLAININWWFIFFAFIIKMQTALFTLQLRILESPGVPTKIFWIYYLLCHRVHWQWKFYKDQCEAIYLGITWPWCVG